ncbi:MAG: arylsulfatase, partial [Candidatus Cryptobacteroides sp.]
SDNGGCPGMEPYCTNKPLRGNKFLEFEGGVRVSCAVWWENGNVRGGRKIDEVTAFVDFVPTVKSILKDKKAPANPYDGIDITSLLNGKTDRIDRTVYLGVGAAVNRQWKMVLAGRNDGMKLKEDMFIDIEKDPSEELPYNGYTDKSAEKALREMILEYDAIKPYYKEIPYGQGKDGFKAPFEWIVTKD